MIFPDYLSPGAQTSLNRPVDIIRSKSGFEYRNAIHEKSLREYDVSVGIHEINDLYDLVDFWEATQGALIEFKFKDWLDFKSIKPNENTSSSDTVMELVYHVQGDPLVYKLRKGYGVTNNIPGYYRDITKPKQGTISINLGVGSPDLIENTHYVVDYETGLVYFKMGEIDSNQGIIDGTHTITAGFEFFIPCRFQSGKISFSVQNFLAGQLPQVIIYETAQQQHVQNQSFLARARNL